MTQREALAILKTGFNVFLTGEPGSGKTHTIDAYATWLKERSVEPAITASTGIAATHLSGMTIHSWSGIGVKRDISDYDIELIMSREKTAKRIIAAKVLIIDEISMLDARVLDSVDRILRTLRRRPMQEEEPFGGLQVVFVGDFFQLPPVSRQEESRFAFESRAWREANPVICYLSEQHRQEDKEFLELLSAMRRGGISAAHRSRLRGRSSIATNAVATRLYTHNADVDRINNEALAQLDGASRPYQMTSRGSKSLVESLKAQCLSPETLELKEGAAVMFTRNNFDAGYVNGTLGEVVNFTKLGEPVVKTRTGSITVEPAEWAIADGSKILARITQLPLRLAWAITVHKSQGMSLDAAIIDLSQAFEYGQGYVALSRVRTFEGLYLEGFNERALELHPKVAEADRHFRTYSDTVRKKFSVFPEAEKKSMEKNFLRVIGGKDPKLARKARAAKPAADGFAAVRATHANAYKKWTKEDDEKLEKLFRAKESAKKMAEHFDRKPGAIRSRLMHLGLVPNPWIERRKESRRD